MNEREFKESLNDFLNEKTYIVAYRSNYDSARDFNNELINYIKRLESERAVLKSISNMKTGLFGVQDELLYNELYEKTKDCGRTQFVKLLMEKEREKQELIDYLKEEQLFYYNQYKCSKKLEDLKKYNYLINEYDKILSKIEKE